MGKPFLSSNPADAVLSDSDLLAEFISLGDNVELGYIQRICGAEPLGLFRFSTSEIEKIIDVLRTRLAHLYTDDDLEVFEHPESDQYLCRSRRYKDFTYQTLVSLKKATLADMTARERKKTTYLKSRFLEQLSESGRIFVRKGSDSLHDLRRLRAALVAQGPHVLLIVAVADAAHPAGTVERIEDGILRGYVTHFKVCSRPEPFDAIGWVNVCRAAYRLVHPGSVLASQRKIAAGTTLPPSSEAAPPRGIRPSFWKSWPGDWPTWRGRRGQRLTVGRDGSILGVLASRDMPTDGLEPRETIVFAAWVWIPTAFAGREVDAWFVDMPILYRHPADLERRDCWQRIWVSMRARPGSYRLVAVIRAQAAAGASIYLGDWIFETGVTPTSPPLDLRQRLDRAKRSGAMAQAEPANPSAAWFRRAAESLIARRAFVDADDLLSRALDSYPHDPALAKLHAQSAHASVRYAGAIPRWIRAMQIAPGDPDCYVGFAYNLREHSSLDRATEVIETALALFPEDKAVLVEAARIAEATNRHADALSLWDKTIALHGADPTWVARREQARRAVEI